LVSVTRLNPALLSKVSALNLGQLFGY